MGHQKKEKNKIKKNRKTNIDNERHSREREFHDKWSKNQNVETIDIRRENEVCTAPEMRYIIKRLGNIKDKRILDLGFGLGEASVYFALQGACVTATDLSPGVLAATSRLAKANNLKVTTHVSVAENLLFSEETKFDLIYAGGLLHHVDIDQTISKI